MSNSVKSSKFCIGKKPYSWNQWHSVICRSREGDLLCWDTTMAQTSTHHAKTDLTWRVLKSVSKLQIINKKGRKLWRASAKVVLLCKRESMGRKAMGRGEWTKLIKPPVSGFRAVLTFGVFQKFSFCLCVLPKDCLGQKWRILLLPGI